MTTWVIIPTNSCSLEIGACARGDSANAGVIDGDLCTCSYYYEISISALGVEDEALGDIL